MTTLADLSESKKSSELIALSEGLETLTEECAFLVPDTSFVINGIFSNKDFIKIDPQGMYSGKRKIHNLFSLIGLYDDIVTQRTSTPNPEEFHEILDRDLSNSTHTFEALLDLFRRDILRVPSQVYEELMKSSRLTTKSLGEFKNIIQTMMKKGYTHRLIADNQRTSFDYQESRKAYFRKQYHSYVKGLITRTGAAIGNVKTLTDFAEAGEIIIKDREIFEDPDKRIVDGALELGDVVGIATCDYGFLTKANEVLRLRRSEGLENPPLVLMVASQDFRGYHLKRY